MAKQTYEDGLDAGMDKCIEIVEGYINTLKKNKKPESQDGVRLTILKIIKSVMKKSKEN